MSLPGLQLISRDDRLIFQDVNASPLAYAQATPSTPCPVTYSGNSMLIPVRGINSPLSVSVGPTDGWWYRVDSGPWLRPSYAEGWLTLQPGSNARLVEITYFDSRFRQGLFLSAILLLLLAFLLAIPTHFRAW